MEAVPVPSRSSSKTVSGLLTNELLRDNLPVQAAVKRFLHMFHQRSSPDESGKVDVSKPYPIETLREEIGKMCPLVKMASMKCLMELFKGEFDSQMRYKVSRGLAVMAEFSTLPSEIHEAVDFMSTRGVGTSYLRCSSTMAAEIMLPEIAESLTTLVEKLGACGVSDARRIQRQKMKAVISLLDLTEALKVDGASLQRVEKFVNLLYDGEHQALAETDRRLFLSSIREEKKRCGRLVKEGSFFHREARELNETEFDMMFLDTDTHNQETELMIKKGTGTGIGYTEVLGLNLTAQIVAAGMFKEKTTESEMIRVKMFCTNTNEKDRVLMLVTWKTDVEESGTIKIAIRANTGDGLEFVAKAVEEVSMLE